MDECDAGTPRGTAYQVFIPLSFNTNNELKTSNDTVTTNDMVTTNDTKSTDSINKGCIEVKKELKEVKRRGRTPEEERERSIKGREKNTTKPAVKKERRRNKEEAGKEREESTKEVKTEKEKRRERRERRKRAREKRRKKRIWQEGEVNKILEEIWEKEERGEREGGRRKKRGVRNRLGWREWETTTPFGYAK